MINEEYPGEEYEKRREEEKKRQKENRDDELENLKQYKDARAILNKKRKKKDKKDPYKERYDYLDRNIDLICNLIYLQTSPKRISERLTQERMANGMIADYITPIIFHKWMEITKHREEIKYAYKVGAEESMHQAQEFLMQWLNNPKLMMQHSGLVREIALFKQRMAGFMDRKRFGSKVEIVDDRPQRKVIEGKDMVEFLASIGKKAEQINSGKIDEEESSEEDELEFEEI